MAKLTDIKSNTINGKTTYTEKNPVLRRRLGKLLEKLVMTPLKAQKLFETICSKIGNVRQAVYQFDLWRCYELYGYKTAKEFVDDKQLPVGAKYFTHLKLARIEINIRPHLPVGKIDAEILKKIGRLGDPTSPSNNKHTNDKLHRECWIAAQKIANNQPVTLAIIKEVVDDFLLFLD